MSLKAKGPYDVIEILPVNRYKLKGLTMRNNTIAVGEHLRVLTHTWSPDICEEMVNDYDSLSENIGDNI